MIHDLAPVERGRAAHGVDDVLIEAREEPEPVLAGQPVLDRCHAGIRPLVAARALAVVDYGNAAGLASRDGAALEHGNLETALNQLVRGTHSGHAAAEDYDPSGHASPGLCLSVWSLVAGLRG